MEICEAIQKNWDKIVERDPFLASILPQAGNMDKGELFKKSFGLVWNHFEKVQEKDQDKSTLLMIAPPYRKMELLECVLKILVAKEKINANFLTPEQIKSAWQSKTQVMLCFNCNGKLKRIAYTPKDCDIEGENLWYQYGNSGRCRCSLNSEKAIVLKAECKKTDGRISGTPNLCFRDRDEHLFGEEGFLTLKRAIVIVGNKNNETVELLRNMTVGGRSLWDAFSAVELNENGVPVKIAKGNGTPSIIVVKDYGRLENYFQDTEGRYDSFWCVICCDSESIKENGTDGMSNQIVIRSSETIVENLIDDPRGGKKYYKDIFQRGSMFIWDRHFDGLLLGEDKAEKKVEIITHTKNTDVWKSLPSALKKIRGKLLGLESGEDLLRRIFWVYKQLFSAKVDVSWCKDVLLSINSSDTEVLSVVESLKTLVCSVVDYDSDKMNRLKSFLLHNIKPDWRIGILSRSEDYSLDELMKFGREQKVPINAMKVATPTTRTIAYKKMSSVVANRYWLFDYPSSRIYWFLYEEEMAALDAQSELLDDLETRQVMPKKDRAIVLGVSEDLLYEFSSSKGNVVNEKVSLNCNVQDVLAKEMEAQTLEENSLESAIARYYERDFSASISRNQRGDLVENDSGICIKFTDNSRICYGDHSRSKVLVEINGDRREVGLDFLKPGQKIFLIHPGKARRHAEDLYGSPEEAVSRWKCVLREMTKKYCHLDYLASCIRDEMRKLNFDREISANDLHRYAKEGENAIELPYNSVSKASILFCAIGIVGKDVELSNQQYSRGLAGVIQDAHCQNRNRGRNYMKALKRDWLEGKSDVSDCFSENEVLEFYKIDADDILTEE